MASPSQHQRPPKQQHYQSQPPHQRGAVSSPIIGDYRGGTAQLNDSSHTPIRRGTPRDSYGSDIVGPPRTHPHSYAHALNDTVATYSGGGSIAQHHQSAESADGHIWQVHFKRAHRNFLLSHSLSPRAVKPGDFVKVEADRGEDMGVVVSKVPGRDFNEFVPTAGYRGRGFSSGQGEKKFILRLATPEERAALIDKVRDEEKALEVIREKVMERRLPMTVLDAEYQFDRHKLIFFFEADRRIDFRELVSDLFSLYKTRIWMQQVDTSVLPDHELRTEIARVAGFLPSSYDPRELYNYTDPDVLSNPPTMLQAPLLNTSRSYGSPSSYASPTTLLSPSRLPSGSASSRYGSDAMPLLPQHNQHQQSFGLDPGGTNLRFGPSQVATCRAVGGPTAAGAGTMFNFMGEQTESQVQPALSFTQFPLFTSETYADPFTAVHSVINYPSGPVTGEGTGLVSNSFYSCFESSNAQTGSDFTEPLRSSLGDFSAPRPSVSKLSDTSSSPGTGGGEAEAALKEESTEQPDSNNLFGIDKWSALKH